VAATRRVLALLTTIPFTSAPDVVDDDDEVFVDGTGTLVDGVEVDVEPDVPNCTAATVS
jgi:hypothetical protein